MQKNTTPKTVLVTSSQVLKFKTAIKLLKHPATLKTNRFSTSLSHSQKSHIRSFHLAVGNNHLNLKTQFTKKYKIKLFTDKISEKHLLYSEIFSL